MSENKIMIQQKNPEEIAFDLYKEFITPFNYSKGEYVFERLKISEGIKFKQACFLAARAAVLEGKEIDVSSILLPAQDQ